MRLERVEHDIAARRIVESPEIPSVGIGNDGAVAAAQRAAQNSLYGGAFPRARGPDQLEVLRLIGQRNRGVTQGNLSVLAARLRRPQAFAMQGRDDGAPLVNF